MSEEDRDPDEQDSDHEPTGENSSHASTEDPGDPEAAVLPSIQMALTIVLAVALIVSAVGVVYVAVTPQETADPHTEFYILGPDGKAADYPTNLTTGEQAEVIVGVGNHEHRDVTYTVVVTAADRQLATRTFTVANDATWERTMTYSLEEPGRTRVQFLLYRGSEATGEPYRSLRLWTNVTAPSNNSTDIQ